MTTRITGLTISGSEIKIDYNTGRYYAKGVNHWPGDYKSKVQWMYNCTRNQGVACQNPPVDQIINDTKVNYISFIQNLSIVEPTDLVIGIPMSSTDKTMSDPCNNQTTGCTCDKSNCIIYPKGSYMQGSLQTSKKDITKKLQPCEQRQLTIPYTKSDLTKLHKAGITLALTLGSWCSRFPRKDEATYWSGTNKNPNHKSYKSFLPGAKSFVKRFEDIRKSSGNVFDGIDFDWEGYCLKKCLGDACNCTWGANCKGDGSEPSNPMKTSQINKCKTPVYNNNNKIIGYTKATNCWTMTDQTTISIMNAIAKEMQDNGYTVTGVPISSQLFSDDITLNDQNQYVRYGFNPDFYDGVMLQWYSGFDAGICDKAGLKYTDKEKNYPRPIADGTKNEEPFSNFKKLCQAKNMPRASYSNYYGRSIYHCPRAIDCPDWRYKGSDAYQEQTDLISKLENYHKGITSKLIIGFEFYKGIAQWGPEPLPEEWGGLNKALKLHTNIKNDLAGYGGWTIYGTMKAIDNCGSHDGEPWKSHMHFRQNVDECWGSWGRYNKELYTGSKSCINIDITPTPAPTSVTGLKAYGCDWISDAPTTSRPSCNNVPAKSCNCTIGSEGNCTWGSYAGCDTAECRGPVSGFKNVTLLVLVKEVMKLLLRVSVKSVIIFGVKQAKEVSVSA